ncbi:rab-like protein 6 isoform X1 [Acipenser oxyrinchus oxyrinchus]|uniref:Rab-like protein 6 isoform X1 n=1 Tax=Acipenser oxyrinchus oxyrinchus TaxID=40147 RepID=A0AAD8CRI1_ACIOX|nr:rab-like protein 6 isoform X1 [Acipenser oxyrinchus oxyrinchus]
MFSALKKLVGSEPGQVRDKNIPAGLQSMNQNLQRRFAKGVQYNMKIVIRGDRNTGKSTLWHRLQGKKFLEEYLPTQEIQVTSIHWNYKTTDDVVKVEVWDVVDKGKSKKRGDSLKVENEPQESENEMALDAEFLDVYKNCNGVIMMFDITKQWTFNYILRELPRVPNHVPVCVLGNHRDMGEHRVILPDDIRDFIVGMNRPPGSSYIHYAESSMRNGFGLKYLHRFFNIPFLQLQRETLLRQLETNQLDIDATLEELTVQQETEDQNYEIFLEMMDSRSKGYASPVPTNGQSPSSGSQSPIIPPNGASTENSSPGTPQPLPPTQTLLTASSPSPPPLAVTGTAPPAAEIQTAQQAVAPPPPPAQAQEPSPPVPSLSPTPFPSAAANPVPPPQKRSIISRLFGSSSTPETATNKPESSAPAPTEGVVKSVDDFVPDDGLDRSFLEDTTPQRDKVKPQPQPRASHDSDSDGEDGGGNPMVAGFQDDLDTDDEPPHKPVPIATVPSKNITLSSDEEDQGGGGTGAGQDTKWSSKNSVKPPTKTKTVTTELKADAVNLPPPLGPEKVGSLKTHLSPSPAPAPAPAPAAGSKKKSDPQEPESSDTDLEGPVAKQLLSFVMDDPDFDSEESDSQIKKVDVFPVRDEISDLSDNEFTPSKVPEPLKPGVLAFKPKDSTDLFGLGFEEKSVQLRDSSEEAADKDSKHSSKDKKKKKKKSKEEEEKATKKKHKQKKKEKEEKGGGGDDKKKKSKSKKPDEMGDLEAFLAGVEGPMKSGGGDYEEL